MTKEWVRVGAVSDFSEDGVFGAKIGSSRIALYQVDEEIFATDDYCTHGFARLSRGFLEDGLIECPVHQGLFDVKTGAPKALPCTEPLQTYDTRRDGADIFVLWSESGED
ncbi:non-heme iron oxygenase ferredoxin subunit [Parasphingorhabdus sp.]|uniref:non-heme iron oxygenase ferredoxin subunit n=1 Tax=Parasphingorhabdus sp. TaxID=2709688 RepID=UPI003267F8B5